MKKPFHPISVTQEVVDEHMSLIQRLVRVIDKAQQDTERMIDHDRRPKVNRHWHITEKEGKDA